MLTSNLVGPDVILKERKKKNRSGDTNENLWLWEHSGHFTRYVSGGAMSKNQAFQTLTLTFVIGSVLRLLPIKSI